MRIKPFPLTFSEEPAEVVVKTVDSIIDKAHFTYFPQVPQNIIDQLKAELKNL